MAKKKNSGSATIGHNSGTEVPKNETKSFFERLLRLDEEIDALNSDKKELYAEMKGSGYDVAAFKKVYSDYRKKEKDPDKYQHAVAMAELYREALGF